jgi:hypothetical protein
VLSISDLEDIRSNTGGPFPGRNATSDPASGRGVWEITPHTLINEYVSVHRSLHGESNLKSSECTLSGTYACEPSRAKSTEFLREFSVKYLGILVELTESRHQFHVDKVFPARLVSDFFVSAADFIGPSEY